MAQQNRGHRAFTWEEVDAIRFRYANGQSQGQLARAFGVTINTIGRIVREETYMTNSRTRIEQPQAKRMHIDPENPKHIQEFVENLLENNRALGYDVKVHKAGETPMLPDAPKPAEPEKVMPEGLTMTQQMIWERTGKLPEDYQPAEADSNNQLAEPGTNE